MSDDRTSSRPTPERAPWSRTELLLACAIAAVALALRLYRIGWGLPMVFEEATQHPDWCPIAPTDIVIELPDTLWSPLVRRFLDTLPGQRTRAHALFLPEVPIPSRADAFAQPASIDQIAGLANPHNRAADG